MTKGQLDNAIRRALNLLDQWNDVTGVVAKESSYYYELQSVITDAVHCGAQAETGDFRRIGGEVEMEGHPPGAPDPRGMELTREQVEQALSAATKREEPAE
jgi:hypothetical protein